MPMFDAKKLHEDTLNNLETWNTHTAKTIRVFSNLEKKSEYIYNNCKYSHELCIIDKYIANAC